jgi:proteasome lid subunit RPN8/RPN11
MATLHLSESVVAQLRERCEASYPREACGLLLGQEQPREGKGPKRMVLRLHPARNLNAERPERRYDLDPRAFIAADTLARAEGLDILGVYHSHPDHPPNPSPTDLAGAQPGWSYVILAVKGEGSEGSGESQEYRSWTLDGGAFVEEKTCVC